MFSIPLNPKLDSSQFDHLIDFLQRNKHLIYDVYFTCRIPPFTQDAMGEVFASNNDIHSIVHNALVVQQVTGIPISATFNNIHVSPSQENLDIWIREFTPLYNAGIRTVTLPHSHWVATGQIQKAFPELKIKNTILRNVREPSEVYNAVRDGFDYINLDRDLMRSQEKLKRVVAARDKAVSDFGREIHLSLLANEGCWGNCSMMDEHFTYNAMRSGNQAQYFNSAISCVSCPKWDAETLAHGLKVADIPPMKEDWDEFLDIGIDVFKMHGRESVYRLLETMEIVDRFSANKPVLYDDLQIYMEVNEQNEKPIDAWRKKIKNCNFDCWECDFCDELYRKKSQMTQVGAIELDMVAHVVDSIKQSSLIDNDYKVSGITSDRVKDFIYNICKGFSRKHYLEIGSANGSTAEAAKMSGIKVTCIDNLESSISSQDNSIKLQNEFMLEGVNFINSDYKDVDVESIDSIDVFFYDADHSPEETSNALKKFSPKFGKWAVLIFDDANWEGVVDSVNNTLDELDIDIMYSKKILNAVEDPSQWWNGLYVLIVR